MHRNAQGQSAPGIPPARPRRDRWASEGRGWRPCGVARGRPRLKRPERELMSVRRGAVLFECRSAKRPNPHLIGNCFIFTVSGSLTVLRFPH